MVGKRMANNGREAASAARDSMSHEGSEGAPTDLTSLDPKLVSFESVRLSGLVFEEQLIGQEFSLCLQCIDHRH
jgi:hypothetical protein